MKKYLEKMYINAALLNDDNVLQALQEFSPAINMLDVGCWTGEKTLQMAKAAKAKNIFGIEPVEHAAIKAKKNGIETYKVLADSQDWPIDDNSIDCIVSNQVVEHLTNLDHFFNQASRVLKPGGILISSTNNLASWHNILPLFLGWTPFDLTNSSSKVAGVGNPLAVHRGSQDERGSSWTHKCVYTTKWLAEWQQIYGLKFEKVYGAGLYPLHAKMGKVFPKYAAFITVVTRKGD